MHIFETKKPKWLQYFPISSRLDFLWDYIKRFTSIAELCLINRKKKSGSLASDTL